MTKLFNEISWKFVNLIGLWIQHYYLVWYELYIQYVKLFPDIYGLHNVDKLKQMCTIKGKVWIWGGSIQLFQMASILNNSHHTIL